MESAQLVWDQSVNINVFKGKIIIEPNFSKYTRLNVLLVRITSENIHDKESFGSRVGKEIL